MAFKYIDVSTHQGVIDFEKVKAAGVHGVIIRAGYGQNNIDAQFKRNISECNRLGIPCGVYWFSYAYTEAMARQEAEYCLAAIKPYRVELPVCYDFEYASVDHAQKNGVGIGKTLATAFVHAFCSVIEKAGYYAMNYTNKDYLSRYFDETVLKYDLWFATYPARPDPNKPPRECGIWQYTSKGRINGINANVDVNAAYKDYPTIIRDAELNNLKASAPDTAERPSAYATEACRRAVNKGIIQGDGNGKYNWREPVTRQDLCVILNRLGLL